MPSLSLNCDKTGHAVPLIQPYHYIKLHIHCPGFHFHHLHLHHYEQNGYLVLYACQEDIWRTGVVKSTPWLLYPRENSPPLNKRLEPKGQPGCFGGKKNIWTLLGSEKQFFGYPVISLLTIPNMLSWIPALAMLPNVHEVFTVPHGVRYKPL
jgi:hypothetical protein